MRIAFHAPMKPPDDPVPSGDRRMARLFVEAFERGGVGVEIPSAFRSYDRGDPCRQARLETIGHRLADRLIARWRGGGDPPPDAWFTYHLYHKAPDHFGPRVARALAIPYIVAEASHAPKQAGGPFDVGHRAAARAIAAADRIHCLNPVDAACLAPLVARPDVLSPLAPFLDTAPFAASPDQRGAARSALEAAFGLDPAVPVILVVAMMRHDQKLASYRVLADAFSRLGPRPFQVLVVGGGPAEAEVRSALAPLGDRVVFAGERGAADLPALYAGCDLFAWPAVKEAFGMAFLEAAAAGLACVAGRSGGIDAIVEDGVTGLIVPAGDAAAMAHGIARLLDDGTERAAMGRQAAGRAVRVNGIDLASANLVGDMHALIARHAKRPMP